MELFVKKMD